MTSPKGSQITVFTDISDGLVKVRIHHRWHRDQQMPSHMGGITHAFSIVRIELGHKFLSAMSLRFACHRYVGTACCFPTESPFIGKTQHIIIFVQKFRKSFKRRRQNKNLHSSLIQSAFAG